MWKLNHRDVGALPTEAGSLVGPLLQAFGPATKSIIHYGSRAQNSGFQSDSEYDFFVVTDEYRSAIQSLVKRGGQRFSFTSGSLVARMLPPTIIGITVTTPTARKKRAKCVLISAADLALACSPAARDHFVKGRLCQFVQIAWARDEVSALECAAGINRCRRATFDWVQHRLPDQFSPAEYFLAFLRVSFAAEIRPEISGRVEELLNAQRETMLPVYHSLLTELVHEGSLKHAGKGFALKRTVSSSTARRIACYFVRSKVRATLRWAKSIWMYQDWLEYLTQKLRRRAGVHFELSPLERRWPLVLLWPKMLRYLLSGRLT